MNINCKPSLQCHKELEKYLNVNAKVCYSKDDYIKIGTMHLRDNTKLKTLLKNNECLKINDLRELLQYPNGLMFIEIGGRFEIKNNEILLYNTCIASCWDGTENKPFLTDNEHCDWHTHPWNVIGYGYPPFYSDVDIENAFEFKKFKMLFVGNPFYYKWPFMFLLDCTNCDIKGKKILLKKIEYFSSGVPFLDPQEDWDKLIKELKKYNIYLTIKF